MSDGLKIVQDQIAERNKRKLERIVEAAVNHPLKEAIMQYVQDGVIRSLAHKQEPTSTDFSQKHAMQMLADARAKAGAK